MGTQYDFGPFCFLYFNEHSQRLLRGMQEVRARPLVLKVLKHLLDHPGQPFDAPALVEAVWGAHFLNRGSRDVARGCICELRKAMGDRQKPWQFIETVSRRWQFNQQVPIHRTELPQGPGGPETEPPPTDVWMREPEPPMPRDDAIKWLRAAQHRRR